MNYGAHSAMLLPRYPAASYPRPAAALARQLIRLVRASLTSANLVNLTPHPLLARALPARTSGQGWPGLARGQLIIASGRGLPSEAQKLAAVLEAPNRQLRD